MARKMMKGISTLNPVDVERDYYLYTVDYAISHGFDHYQLIGPIHDGIKGNIDGMTFSKKYARFNDEKNADYVNYCLEVVNEGLEKLSAAGVKTYMWHHELELPFGFNAAFPEALNEYGDIEVTHPVVKDYLENKIIDFFDAYPKMDGIILTLHETKVPLLKLKKQKLNPTERVKYVTEILYTTCKSLGKELIVRPFASIEEDYEMMTKAYEEISRDLIIMDKWTQFDWSLCLPDNRFYAKIKNNPLFVEADIFGEFFGKGRLPLMLRSHITNKFSYCEKFSPVGYVARIDRAGLDPFGEVNEVNLIIMHAVLSGDNVDEKIDQFFNEKYGKAGAGVREIMENTEDILKKIIYLNGYYYSQLSLFPRVNHCKNHFYFEMMRDDWRIASNEWFIPIGWQRGSLDSVMEEKASAAREAEDALNKLIKLESEIEPEAYKSLYTKFKNLELVAKIWKTFTDAIYNYAKYFEYGDEKYKTAFYNKAEALSLLNESGKKALGDDFYCISGDSLVGAGRYELIAIFLKEIKESFWLESKSKEELDKENLYDYIICGGASEGHALMKEVNFSDTLVSEGALCRIPGHMRREGNSIMSLINAHGWFSYEIKVKPGEANRIVIVAGGYDEKVDMRVTLGDKVFDFHEGTDFHEYCINYEASADETAVRIRIDRISPDAPLVRYIKVI